ncbi:MAG: amidohydrolase, partial [Vicinamibacterales bacterium]
MRFLLPVFIVIAVASAPAQPAPADLIIHSARIYTADDMRPRAEGLAVRGDRIVAVGSSADVLAMRGPRSSVIDAAGATVIPGLHDSHGHFVNLGASLQILPLTGTTSWEQVVSMVRRATATAPAGAWIQGRGWDQNDWSTKEFPNYDLLTAAAPSNPVFLTRIDGHAAVANRAALEAAGITRDTPDPEGGRIIRDGSGNPTGTLIDQAMGLVSRRIPPVSATQLEEQILRADAETRRFGLTMVHD